MGRRALPAALALAAFAACSGGTTDAEPPATGDGRLARVTRIVDGDTIIVRSGVVDGDERVRLIGIDTPESVQPGSPVECFALEAARYLGELVPLGTEVRLAGDVEPYDRYGRTLSYVYRTRDDLFVNAALVRDGYAYAYTVPPNVAHADEFATLQGEAQAANRGLWEACPPP